MDEEVNLSAKERIRAIWHVARMTYQSAPGALYVELVSAILSALLPIITTFFAAQTTTALVRAFSGVKGAAHEVIILVVITSALGIISTLWGTISNYLRRAMRYKIESAVSDRLYEHFLRLDFWRYNDKSTIDTYDKAVEFSHFFANAFNRLSNVLSQTVSLVIGLVAVTIVGWWLGLILLLAVIPGIVIQFRLSRLQRKNWSENVVVRRSRNMIEWQLLQPDHMSELRLYSMARYLLDLRISLREQDLKAEVVNERKFILKRFGADALEAVAEVVALIWTVLQIIQHHLPIGQFVYVQQIVSRTLNGASGLVGALNDIDSDLANLFDYQTFMDFPETIEQKKKHILAVPHTITFDHVSFSYPNADSNVLTDISFTIHKGDRLSIVGENGAGKTTLISLLTGLYVPTKGAILIDGEPLKNFYIEDWQKLLAVLQQQYLTFNFASAKHNIIFGDISRPFSKKRYDKALANAEATEIIESLPNKENSYLLSWMKDKDGNKGRTLSGGQGQRVAIARNFYRDSPIVILDEPTSAIDALAEARIFKNLFNESSKTIISISHRLPTVKKSDHIIMLEHGKIVEEGTHRQLVEKKGAYFHMFESQL